MNKSMRVILQQFAVTVLFLLSNSMCQLTKVSGFSLKEPRIVSSILPACVSI